MIARPKTKTHMIVVFLLCPFTRIDPKLRQNDVQDKAKQKKGKKVAPPLTELIPLELWRIGDVCYILI